MFYLVLLLLLRLMTHQTFVAQLCCATCCATKLRALQPCQMQLQQNAQQTWHQVTQTTMFNYSATLLVGAIANLHKRQELITRTWRDVSSYLFTYLPLNYDTPGSRCKSKTGRQNQDRSRLSTNHRRSSRDRSRPVLDCNATPDSACQRQFPLFDT